MLSVGISLFLCAAGGALVGAASACVVNHTSSKFNAKMLETYWQEDLRLINERIAQHDKELYTEIVDKSVDKKKKGGK